MGWPFGPVRREVRILQPQLQSYMAKKLNKQDALDYHAKGRPGKIEVIPTKDTKTQWDLSLAYSPAWRSPAKRSPET